MVVTGIGEMVFACPNYPLIVLVCLRLWRASKFYTSNRRRLFACGYSGIAFDGSESSIFGVEDRGFFIWLCVSCAWCDAGVESFLFWAGVVVDEDGLVGGGVDVVVVGGGDVEVVDGGGDGTAGGGEAQGGYIVVDEDLLDGGGHRLAGGGVPGGDLGDGSGGAVGHLDGGVGGEAPVAGGACVRCLVFLGQWWKEYCFER